MAKSKACSQATESRQNKSLAFGNLAIIALSGALDPWLCGPTFRWVCHCRCEKAWPTILPSHINLVTDAQEERLRFGVDLGRAQNQEHKGEAAFPTGGPSYRDEESPPTGP